MGHPLRQLLREAGSGFAPRSVSRCIMIRATELAGRPVIDINAAEKVGTIEKLILDPDGKRVAGFVVTQGGRFAGNKEHLVVPASAIRAIGPDAVTIKRDAII